MSGRVSFFIGRWVVPLVFFALSTNAQFGPFDGNNDNPWGAQPGRINDGDGDNDRNSLFGSDFGANYQSYNRATIAHGIMACVVWAILIPFGGILLRLNIQSPWVLRLHAFLQVFSYLCYVAAAGIGIWLVRAVNDGPYLDLWNNSHVRLGLAILIVAFFQPILGAVHHGLFKKRSTAHQAGKSDVPPGRTTPGYVHLWLGRVLIILGIINGGLGLHLASQSPFGSYSTTLAIVYGVIAGVIFLIYFVLVILFEVRRSKRNQQAGAYRSANIDMDETPPTYIESQDSLQKDHGGVTRYS